MAADDHPLTQEEFDSIYAKVPRLTVELLVKDAGGAVLLIRRAIEPCRGQWQLPGGTVRFGEHLQDAVSRVAKRELDIEVCESVNTGYIEYPSHYLHGLDSPVGMVFEVVRYRGEARTSVEASHLAWFSMLPEDMHADQDDFLLERGHFPA